MTSGRKLKSIAFHPRSIKHRCSYAKVFLESVNGQVIHKQVENKFFRYETQRKCRYTDYWMNPYLAYSKNTDEKSIVHRSCWI